ncbi:MAG: cell division protein FtsX [Pseudohongiella sp.]|nr:cell division protein FtsX [Pseudohongiella sp.]|tara:strand:+ start:12808 stop:14019 length:1212 start_codon:yes stop_codon:yes gene_type:complete
MELGPITRALLRNKLGVILIALQIAFTMTVIVNAVYIINDRAANMARPSGLDEANTFHISSIGYGNSFNESVVVDEDLNMIRQLPGVIDATVTNAIPVSGSGSSSGYGLEPGRRDTLVPAAIYRVDEHVLEAMDLDLVAGVPFTAQQIVRRTPTEERQVTETILSQAMAESLYPDDWRQALNQNIYGPDGSALRVVGIVDRLQAPWPTFTYVENSMLTPEITLDNSTTYLVRTEPGYRDELMVEVEERLATAPHQRILRNNQSLEYTRTESYRIDSLMTTILKVVIGTLMFITAMGIVGLAVFSINRRRKQIGTRRALGATRFSILRYFMTENLIISAAGVTLGAIMTVGFNMFLVQTFNMPRIDWFYAPIGMLALLLLGQLAVIGPARSAAAITPALATRSV